MHAQGGSYLGGHLPQRREVSLVATEGHRDARVQLPLELLDPPLGRVVRVLADGPGKALGQGRGHTCAGRRTVLVQSYTTTAAWAPR
jgi:hypothetical protein